MSTQGKPKNQGYLGAPCTLNRSWWKIVFILPGLICRLLKFSLPLNELLGVRFVQNEFEISYRSQMLGSIDSVMLSGRETHAALIHARVGL